MDVFKIGLGDTAKISVQFLNVDNTAIDLSGVTSVEWHFMDESTNEDIGSGSCTITDAENGTVEFSPSETVVANPGMYLIYFKLTYADGTQKTVPTHDVYYVEVLNY